MIQTDRAATTERRFEDDRSKILKDGRLILFGADWEAQKLALWMRCGGKCEHEITYGTGPQGTCGSEAQDPHHVIRRSVKRDDRLANLQALCRFHHDLLDKRKVRSDKRPAA